MSDIKEGDRVRVDGKIPGTGRVADAEQHAEPTARTPEQILADAAREILAQPEWTYAQDRRILAYGDSISITAGHLRALVRRYDKRRAFTPEA